MKTLKIKSIIILISLVFVSCATPVLNQGVLNKRVSKVEISDLNSEGNLTEVEIDFDLINPELINQLSLEGSSRQSSFNIENIQIDNSKKDYSEKNKISDLLYQVDKEGGDLSEETRNDLKRRIVHESFGSVSIDLPYYSNSQYNNPTNPFIVNGKELTVVRIKLRNVSNTIKKIKHSSFQLQTDSEFLEPYSQSELSNMITPSASINLKRLNLAEEVSLTPNQEIISYIAFPTINYDNENISIQFIDGQSYYTQKFFSKISYDEISSPYNVYEIIKNRYKDGERIFAVRIGDKFTILRGNTFVIPSKYIGRKFDLLELTIFDNNSLSIVYYELDINDKSSKIFLSKYQKKMSLN